LAIVLATIVGWTTASTLSYAMPLTAWIFKDAPYTSAPLAAGVFIVATAIVMFGLFAVVAARREAPITQRVIDGVALLVLAIAAARRDSLFADNGHLAFFVGPLEMVRQGGWLLWDVPSQYGFGNILTMAALPFRTSYDDEFVLNALLMFAAAAAMYFVFRWKAGALGAVFAAALALAAVFLIGGDVCCNLMGPEHYPSIGPVRFFWCYALGAIALLTYVQDDERIKARLLIAGSIGWALSGLWSAESFIYGSCIWFPFLGLTVANKYGSRALWRWLPLPVLVLLCAVGLIDLVYRVALGHLPDWFGFVDYGLSYQGGYGEQTLSTLGDVWALVLSFCALCTIALVLLKSGRLAAAAVVIAACGMEWSTASYFVVRSHPNNVLNILAVAVFALGIALLVAAREQLAAPLLAVVRTSVAPIFIVTIGLSFSASGGFAHYVLPFGPATPQHLSDSFIEATPQSVGLFQRAGMTPSSPLIYGSDSLARVWPGYRTVMPTVWVPAYPPAILNPLGPERALVYINRFVDRRPMDGYILTYTDGPTDDATYVIQLRKLLTHRFDRRPVGADGNLRLEKFTLRR